MSRAVQRVARVAAVLTDPVTHSGPGWLIRLPVNAFVDDPYLRFRLPPQVTVTVTVKKSTTQ